MIKKRVCVLLFSIELALAFIVKQIPCLTNPRFWF